MKMKSINKILTSVLSVSLLMGSALPVLAAEGGVDVDAPIYSLDITNVIVPTSYAVAFNPEGLEVKTGTGTVSGGDAGTSTDQILSKTYGIINKSSKDKLITVTLNVKDLNGDSGITFVKSEQDVDDAAEGEYKIHLTLIPADGTEVKVAGQSADEETAAADLNDVAMTPAAAGKEVTLMSGENYIGFKLEKAVWTPKEGEELTLGSTNSNDVKDNFEITGLAEDGKSITAFTFGGEMNANADWSVLTQGIRITVIYGNDKVTSDLTAIDGTGAMVELNIAPTFATGSGVGQIKYSRGAGPDGLKEITRIELRLGKNVFDGYNEYAGGWPAATEKSGVITIPSECMVYWADMPATEAIVVYETNNGDTETATVNVLCQVAPPTFTTGSGVGQINYTPGAGPDGLKEIKKIEMTLNSTVYDGYNEFQDGWPAATDEAGVITISSTCMSYWEGKSTTEATVTYETNSGDIQTVTVDIKCP